MTYPLPLTHQPPPLTKSFTNSAVTMPLTSTTPMGTPLSTPMATPMTTPRRPESSLAEAAKPDEALTKAERNLMLRQTFRNPSPPRPKAAPLVGVGGDEKSA